MMGWMIAAALSIAAIGAPEVAFAASYRGQDAGKFRVYVGSSTGTPTAISKPRDSIYAVAWLDHERVAYVTGDQRIWLVDLKQKSERDIGKVEEGNGPRTFPPSPPGYPEFVINGAPGTIPGPSPRPAFTGLELGPGMEGTLDDSTFKVGDVWGLTWRVGNKSRNLSEDWRYTYVIQPVSGRDQFLFGVMHDSTTGSRGRLVKLQPGEFRAEEFIPAAADFDWWPGRDATAWVTPRRLSNRQWRSDVVIWSGGERSTVPGEYYARAVAVRP